MDTSNRAPYWKTTIEYQGETLYVAFHDMRDTPTPAWRRRVTSMDTFEEVAVAAVEDRQGIMFAGQIFVQPSEDLVHPSWPYPHRPERWALKEIARHLELGDWQRGSIFFFGEPPRPTHRNKSGDMAQEICASLNITARQLAEITQNQARLLPPSTIAVKEDIAGRFSLPSSELLGIQLARKGTLTPEQGAYLDGLPTPARTPRL